MRQLSKHDLQQIWKISNQYLEGLASKAGVVNYKKYLSPKIAPKNMKEVMYQFAFSLQNRQRVTNSIDFTNNKNILQRILYQFDPKKICKNYKNGEDVFKAFERNNELRKKFKESKGTWRKYAKYIYSASMFLDQFKNINDFNEFLEKFSYNTYTKSSLPMLLAKEINGFGFALACDCLKELGLEYYPKPDVHIIEILKDLDLIDEKGQYIAYKTLIEMADQIGCTAYCLDKIFWLNCTGKFYNDLLPNAKNEKQTKKAKTTRKIFLQRLKEKLK